MPPGPSLPRFLQTLGFILIPARFIDRCRRRYGDIVTFGSLFDPHFVMVFDPEMVKQRKAEQDARANTNPARSTGSSGKTGGLPNGKPILGASNIEAVKQALGK